MKRYHPQCVNMTSATFRELLKTSWQCPECINVTKRRANASSRKMGDETPTRGQAQQPEASSSAALGENSANQSITYDLFGKLLDEKLDAKLENFRSTITKEFNQIISKLKEDFRKEIEALRDENEKLKDKLINLESKEPSSHVSKLSLAISELQSQLNDRDQELLLNDVELTEIPEHEGESVGHLVLTAAAKLGMVLEERDVVSATRVGPRRDHVEGASAPRPRPIVVRFTRRSLRDDLLKSARVRRAITTAELGLPEHVTRRFYVNERLTKNNRALFAKAREAGRNSNWRFIWTRDGRVYARRDQSAPRLFLRSESDVVNFLKL